MNFTEPYIMKIQDKKEPRYLFYFFFIIGILAILLFAEVSAFSVISFLFCLIVFIIGFYKIDKVTKQLKEINSSLESAKAELENKNRELIMHHEREKLENELIIANRELTFQNEEKEKRTNELLTANKELSAFTYIASHDLQEPLRKTQLFLSRILEDKEQLLSEKNLDYFKRMEISSRRMQLLINDLLSYSRVNESDKELTNVYLNDVIDNVLEELTLIQTIEEKNATITCGSLPQINGIPFQLEQLFTNLISNSIKYSYPDRPPVIDIQYTVVKGTEMPETNANPGKSYYKITITDNGIGFEQENAEKIFMLFQRLHDKQKYAGTGIGLTICKKITENHHGFITATSIPDQGSTFTVYLPSADAAVV